MATSRRSRRPGPGQFPRLRLLAVGGLAVLVLLFIASKAQPLIYKWRLKTVEATYGTEETVWRANGFILRVEDTVDAPAPGRVTLLVGEGRRVRAGDAIAELLIETNSGQDNDEITALNRQLDRLRTEYEADMAALMRREQELQDSLVVARRTLNQALASGHTQETQSALEHRDAVMAQLQSVQQRLTTRKDEFERAEAQLLAERERQLAMPSTSAMIVTAPKPGVVSFALDGLEKLAPGESLLTATQPSQQGGQRIHDGMYVNEGDPLFRLVDLTAPVELVVSSRREISLAAGTPVEIVFDHEPGKRVSGRLVEIIRGNREWLGRISLDYADQSLVHRRRDNVQISAHRAEGIVVPARAVFEMDGRRGVYVMLGDRPVYREVRVLGGNEQRVVIDAPRGVPVGAPVVVNPRIVISGTGDR